MNIYFKLLLVLETFAIPAFIGGSMLNYTDPTYDIVEVSPNIWVIDVGVKLAESELKEEDRIRILYKEAEKSSLFSIAFVQKLANDGDEHAKEIQSLYQAYKRYLENTNITILQNVCYEIIQNSPFTLPKDFARYILALISNQAVDPKLEDARELLNKLIPNIESTLNTVPLQKICEEQEVLVPEMKASKHKAFPDLIKYEGVYYAAFREAGSHVGFEDFGAIRILKGYYDPNLKTWSWANMQLLVDPIHDLRDPRFFVNHKNKLQLVFGGSLINEKDETTRMVPHIAILENDYWQVSKAFVDPSTGGINGQWIWRVTWNSVDNYGYAFSYGKEVFSLVKTFDGKTFEKVSDIACEQLTDLSEATIRFKADGTAIALIRARRNGIIGISKPTDGYRTWTFSVIPFRLGGPNFVLSHEEHSMWAATRYFFLHQDNELDEATILASMTQNELAPLLRLKSSYDNSYPGIVLEEDGSLTILYYSSTLDTSSNIYITRVLPIDSFEKK